MSNKPQLFKQYDIVKALRAAEIAGLRNPTVLVRYPNGVVISIGGKPGEQPRGDAETNPWDEVLTDAAHEKRPA